MGGYLFLQRNAICWDLQMERMFHQQNQQDPGGSVWILTGAVHWCHLLQQCQQEKKGCRHTRCICNLAARPLSIRKR